MKKHILILLAIPTTAFSQMAVYDTTSHAIQQQANQDQIAKWVESIGKLNTQIDKLNEVAGQGQQMLSIAGNPSQALSALGGTGVLGDVNTGGLGKLGTELQNTADGLQSLQNTGGGLYKSIPTSLPNGTSIVRDTQGYKPFSAVENAMENFNMVNDQTNQNLTQLRNDLKTTMAKAATTEAEQREKQAKIQALNSEINAQEAVRKAAHDQLMAQKAANDNDREKQIKAGSEEVDQETKSWFKGNKIPKR